MTLGIDQGQFDMSAKPPNIARPRKVEELAPAYEVVHRDAVARIKKLKDSDLDRALPDGEDASAHTIQLQQQLPHLRGQELPGEGRIARDGNLAVEALVAGADRGVVPGRP